MNALYQLGEGLFGETPRCRGYGAECFKARKELCVEGLDVRTKGEGSVKRNAEELGSGVECKGGASPSDLRLMRSLMGTRTDEATFTFSGVDSFQEPFFKVIEGLLDRVDSFQRVRGGRPDGEIISIE